MQQMLSVAIFLGLGVVFVFGNMLIGKLLRPSMPNTEKKATYECGEPTIGSSNIQFDLRFYVVALLFIIFDVEVAFFFPWALVYGNAMQLADSGIAEGTRQQLTERLLAAEVAPAEVISAESAHLLGVAGLLDILVFFGVLLVGFAYVWKRGDLDWVRAVGERDTGKTAV